MNDHRVRLGFYAAAAYNIVGMIVFSKLFTNDVLFATDPGLFSRQGCVLVMIWGLVFLAQSTSWRAAPWVSAAFALEKVFFASSWVLWLSTEAHRLPEIRAADPLAGAFYAVYGLGDALFAVFFAFAFLKARNAPRFGPVTRTP